MDLVAVECQRCAHWDGLLDHLLEEAAFVREPNDLGHGFGRIIGLDIEMRACLGTPGLDVAAFYRPGEEEIELGATCRCVDLDLAYVRVPRKLGKQSKTNRKRGVAERRWPFVVATDGRRLVGVHHVRAEGARLERILAGQELGHCGNRVIDRPRLEVAVAQQAVDARPLDCGTRFVACHVCAPPGSSSLTRNLNCHDETDDWVSGCKMVVDSPGGPPCE